jgi:hypothetical protein
LKKEKKRKNIFLGVGLPGQAIGTCAKGVYDKGAMMLSSFVIYFYFYLFLFFFFLFFSSGRSTLVIYSSIAFANWAT